LRKTLREADLWLFIAISQAIKIFLQLNLFETVLVLKLFLIFASIYRFGLLTSLEITGCLLLDIKSEWLSIFLVV
jgi:hypothetical protein